MTKKSKNSAKNVKTFVLDTNVILHDYSSIFKFEENNVVVPITVLSELDKFKSMGDEKSFHAREFARQLDRLSDDKLFNGGVPLGEGLGKISVEIDTSFTEKMSEVFMDKNLPDHRIIAVAERLMATEKKDVVLVTKDINLRMKAKSVGVMAEDYKNDQITDLSVITDGVVTINDVTDDSISSLYKAKEPLPLDEFSEEVKKSQYAILKTQTSSALVCVDKAKETIERVEKLKSYGIYPRNAEQTFSVHALMNPDFSVVALTGKAGTGKTLLALAAALEQHNKYDQIYLARPIVALGNKDLGHLPGDAKEKIGPYMQPLFDNLSVIKHKFNVHSKEYLKIDELLKEEKLQITPLAYIRGRSLSNTFFIVDEAQNLTPHEIKTILTRAGENAKFIFTGDVDQIDSPYLDKKSNGLSYMIGKMKGQSIFAHINLVKGERSALAELAADLL